MKNVDKAMLTEYLRARANASEALGYLSEAKECSLLLDRVVGGVFDVF